MLSQQRCAELAGRWRSRFGPDPWQQFALSSRDQTYSGFSKTSALPEAALPSSLLSRLRMGPVNQWRAPRIGLYHLRGAWAEELQSGMSLTMLCMNQGSGDNQV